MIKDDERAPGLKAGEPEEAIDEPPRSGEPAEEEGDGGNMGCIVNRRPAPADWETRTRVRVRNACAVYYALGATYAAMC
jgi:hypothetical protein